MAAFWVGSRRIARLRSTAAIAFFHPKAVRQLPNLFVPARRLTVERFGAHAGNLVHDDGFTEVTGAWNAWRQTPD